MDPWTSIQLTCVSCSALKFDQANLLIYWYGRLPFYSSSINAYIIKSKFMLVNFYFLINIDVHFAFRTTASKPLQALITHAPTITQTRSRVIASGFGVEDTSARLGLGALFQ